MGQLGPKMFNKQEKRSQGQVIDRKGILKVLARWLNFTKVEFPGSGSNEQPEECQTHS